jgi:DnaK suppressor protein
MDDRQRKQMESRLLEERASRVEALAQLDDRFKERFDNGDGDLTNYPLHMADEGTDTMEQEKEALLAHQEGEQFLEINEALRRLYKEPEEFGRCERCGEQIAFERLDMVPWARLCISCQESVEAGDESTATR